jgi:hypothetical protein
MNLRGVIRSWVKVYCAVLCLAALAVIVRQGRLCIVVSGSRDTNRTLAVLSVCP